MLDFPLPPPRPSLLEETSFQIVAKEASSAALDVMILGSVEQGNRIVSLLHDYNFLNLADYKILECGIELAWAVSKLQPDFVQNKEQPSCEEGQKRVEPYPQPERRDLDKLLFLLGGTKDDGQKIGKIVTAIEVAIDLDEQAIAENLLQRCIPHIFASDDAERQNATDRRHQLASSRQVWKLLNDGMIMKAIPILEESITEHVDSMLPILTQRFEGGPQRPFKDKTVKELVDLLDKYWLEIKPYEPDQSPLVILIESPIPETFTHKGLSGRKIQQMEKKLGVTLPSDFKEFLTVTDGFYTGDLRLHIDLFKPADLMSWDDNKFPETLELIPYEVLPWSMVDLFQWPKRGRGIQTGSALDEGMQLLIEPETVKVAVEEFDKRYAAASEESKRILERAATDLYGGIENLRKTNWITLVTFH